MKQLLFILMMFLLAGLLSCNAYTIANRHIDTKMKKADLRRMMLSIDDSYEVEYWDNQLENKPVFVFIHGFGAKTKYQWYKQLGMLKDRYRIIMPNLLYFGKTMPASDQYTVEDQVKMVKAFLKKLNINKYTLMGASYGGLISAQIANDNAAEVEQLFIVDAPVKYMYDSDTKRVEDYFDVETIPELFVPSKPEGLRTLLWASSGKKTWVPTTFLTEFHREFYVENRENKIQLVHELLKIREDYANKTYVFDMPTHLIWGERDVLIPPDRAELWKKELPANCTLNVIKKGGHMPNLNKTRRFNSLVESYLLL